MLKGDGRMPIMSRRELVFGGPSLVVLAALLPQDVFAGEEISVETFRALSARLTGASLTDLDARAAARVLAGFLSRGMGPEIARVATYPSASGDAVANEIVAAWYSGTFATSAGLASFGLSRALLWDALDYTKPPALCGGSPGFWAAPPPVR